MNDREFFLNRPRCGLSVRPRAGWLTVERCPRCVARARIAVGLFSSPLRTAELYAEGSVPTAESGRLTPVSTGGER